MRLFLIFLLLLLVSTGWTKGPKSIKCHRGWIGYALRMKPHGTADLKDEKCKGLCELRVSKTSSEKTWNLACTSGEKNAEECSREPYDKSYQFECKCNFDFCLTSEMADEALEKFDEAMEKWEAGERTIKGLFNLTAAPKPTPKPKGGQKTEKKVTKAPKTTAAPVTTNSQGFLASSTMFILHSIAAFVIAT